MKKQFSTRPTTVVFDMHPISDMSDEVQELVWALIDEQATEEQVQRLEQLLLDNREARQIYIACMQMHADLHYLLGGKKFELPEALKEAMAAKQSQQQTSAAAKAPQQGAPLPLVDLPIPPTGMPNSMA